MPRGRPPSPTRLKVMNGTLRADRINLDEPQPDPRIPDCPAHLNATAKAVWAELVDVLGGVGLLTAADRGVMTLYCQAFASWLKAKAKVDEQGAVLDFKGKLYRNPWALQANESLLAVMKTGSLLGLDPASRTKLKAFPMPGLGTDQEDPKARFFKARDEAI
jgi:P27 family predicted phage terminase small subunit